MSKRKRALEKAKKANSPQRKLKRAKKAYYASSAAKQKWEEKKAKRQKNYIDE